MKYILKPAITLFITAAVTVAALSYVYTLTLEPIEKQKRRTQEAAMKDVLPQASNYHEIHTDISGNITAIFEGISGSALTGYVIQLSPEGYSGNIDMMVGISIREEKITGMRVLRHTETPGLGANAVKENFYRRYDNKPASPLTVVRTSPGENEIQAITSSTITTRAITNAVNEAVKWYQDHVVRER